MPPFAGGGSPVAFSLATVPALFDGMQLVLEHSALSDVVFDLVLVSGLVLLGWWRPPRVGAVAVAGVVLGLAVLVRIVGELVVVVAVIFCLLTGVTLRQRLLTAGVVAARSCSRWRPTRPGTTRRTVSGRCPRWVVGRSTCARRRSWSANGWTCPTTSGCCAPPSRWGAAPTLRTTGGTTNGPSSRWTRHRNELRRGDEGVRDHGHPHPAGDCRRTVPRDFWMGFSSWKRWTATTTTRQPSGPSRSGSTTNQASWGPGRTTRTAASSPGQGTRSETGSRGTAARLPARAAASRPGAARTRGAAGPPGPRVAASGRWCSSPGRSRSGCCCAGCDHQFQYWRYQLPALVLLPMAAALGWTRIRAAVSSRRTAGS